MDLNSFVKKYNGKFVEVHGSPNAKNQCTDLVNLYLCDVLNLPIVKWADAKDFPSRVSKNDYDWIPDAPGIVPKKGDLIVWKTNHISICVYSDINLPWFTSFDQNWPTGSFCHKVDHSYTNVKGWLRKKEGSIPNNLKVCLKQHGELVVEAGKKDKIISSQDKELLEYGKEVKILIDKLETAGDDLVVAGETVKQLEKDKKQIKKEIKQVREFLKPYLYFNLSGVQLVKFGLLKMLGSEIKPKELLDEEKDLVI